MADNRSFVCVLGVLIACAGTTVLAGDRAAQCPVLLTFDVEIDSDIEALKQLDPPGSCTLFVTGEFAQAHPDVVRGWAERHEIACHTMTHPHLPQLGAAEQFAEIRESAAAIRKATGSFPLGFRAPYLESNDETREALVQLGFRYQSSAWEINHRDRSDASLLEFPIADGLYKDRVTVAGDYNLFDGDHLSNQDALTFLLKLYNEHRMSGRPLVILLHPHLAAAHGVVIKSFIERVKQAGASWTCFRDWMQDASKVSIKYRAAWVDVDTTPYEPQDLVGHARRLGLTDLLVKAYDPFDGAIFGPGRENDGFFNGMIDEAHRAGIRVHAWFPICYDPQRLKNHPEWGMVDANGQRSDEWVCPTNTPWRQEFLAMFKNLLDNYGVDGIHFDYIRFPNAEVCQCPACRKELSQRAAVKWPLGLALIDQSDTQATWFNYRTDLIHDLAEEFATAIRKWQEGIVVSAALKPEGAIDFDGEKLYGQSYRDLAPLMDFVSPMAYHQLEGEPVAWSRAVQISARWRSGSTPVWHGIQAYEADEHPPMDLGEFGRLLDSMHSGSEGVALFALGPMLSLVTDEEVHSNMPSGADDLVRRWSLGQTLASTVAAAAAARPDKVDVSAHPPGTAAPDTSRGSIGPWLLGLIGGAAAVGLLWSVRARAGRRALTFPDMPLSVLEALASEPTLTGAQAHVIVRSLQALRPAELERIRIKRILSRLIEAGGRLRIEEAEALDPGCLAISEAHKQGWVCNDGQALALNPDGRRFFADQTSQDDDRSRVRFIEERLRESLVVTCPTCGVELAGLWLRPALGCPSCHHRFPIYDSPSVTVAAPART